MGGYSLKRRLVMLLVTIICALAALVTFGSVTSNGRLSANMEQSLNSTLLLYKAQVDGALEQAAAVLSELASGYIGGAWSIGSEDELDNYLKAMQLTSMLDAKVTSVRSVDCLFVLPKAYDGYFRFSGAITGVERLAFKDYANAGAEFNNSVTDDVWGVMRVGDTTYLVKAYVLKSVTIGVIVAPDALMLPITRTLTQTTAAFGLLDADGAAIYRIGGDGLRDAFTLEVGIADSGVKLFGEWRRDTVYADVRGNAAFWFALAAIIVCSVAACVVFVNRAVINALSVLLTATRAVEGGDLDYRIGSASRSEEFAALYAAFNGMTGQIKALKIASYEEQVRERDTRLQFMRMQIQPHFFLNAITTISSLAMRDESKDDVQSFILSLSAYLRYNFTDSGNMTTIKQEVDHARDYIAIQQTRYPGDVFYMIDVAEDVAGVRVPKFLVQTFIENIFKHAFRHGELLSIFISAACVTEDGETYALIRIDDNGDGFGEIEETGAANGRVGIANMRETLSLIYGGRGVIRLGACSPKGARVDVLIPCDGKEAAQ